MTIFELKKQFNTYQLPHHWIKEWLLFVIKKSDTFLITDSDYLLSDGELTVFFDGIKKMQLGTPVQYLTQVAYFWSLPFFVNEHTLIPRPDTELLVENALNLIQKNHQQKTLNQKSKDAIHILELGTGSGCIAISLFKSLEKKAIPCQMTALDNNQNTLAVAKKNADTLNAPIQFLQSDWYKNVSGKFDMIISNPPYIAKDDPHLPALSAEPIAALVSDNQGLSDIAYIIDKSRHYLNDKGILLLEHGYNQKNAVQDLFADCGFVDIHTLKDFGGNDRISFATFNKE